MKIQLKKAMDGRILDIGGGGEGVIGQIYQEQVTAIDIRQEELDEAPDGFLKLLMDASDMTFENASFDHVTAFYSFMYMSKSVQEKVIKEAARVLKKGGKFYIWDTDITIAEPEPFLAELEIDANGKKIVTTYGIVKSDAEQNSTYFVELCEDAQLKLMENEEKEGHFYLCFMI